VIKIVHIGDLHLGGEYPEKAAASIDFLIEQLHNDNSVASHPDIVVCTGDTTEKPLHVHSEHLRPLLKLIRSVTCPLVFLQGTPSHEPYGFLHNLRQASGESFTVLDTPGITPVDIGFNEEKHFRLAALPAINKPMLSKWAVELGLPEGEPDDIIRSILLNIADRWKHFAGPKILLGHWSVTGCATASGQTLYASDLAIGLDDLALTNADAILLGHIHKAQHWGEPESPDFVAYCGSSYPCNWGELDPKSFNVLEFDEHSGLLIQWDKVPYPHRPMVKVDVVFTGRQIDGEWECIFGGSDWPPDFSDVEVKVVYSVPKEIAHQVDDMYIRLKLKQLGIDVAAIERTIRATNRERIADISSKETTRSQYEAVCTAKSEEPRPGALAKADLVDEKVVAI